MDSSLTVENVNLKLIAFVFLTDILQCSYDPRASTNRAALLCRRSKQGSALIILLTFRKFHGKKGFLNIDLLQRSMLFIYAVTFGFI